jgi:lipopolysaccharide export system protein LptC
MRDRITAIIAILLLAALAGASYWYSQVIRFGDAAVPVSREGPDFVVDRATMTQFDATGRATNKLYAESLSHYPSDDRVEVTKPRLLSVRPDQPQIEARSQRARVDKGGELVTMSGDVIVTRQSGADGEPPMKMRTQVLLVEPDTEKFWTDAPIEIERGGSRVAAIGMDYDHLSRVVKFRKQVRGTVEPAATMAGKP